MSLDKPFTARRLAAWSVGIAFAQFVVFSVVFKTTGKIEDALFAAVLAAAFAVLAAAFAAFAASAAVLAAAFAVLAAAFAASAAFATSAAAFAVLAAFAARHQDGTKGSFSSLFYIAMPFGIAGAIFAFAKTGSWWLGVIVLLVDAVGKMIVAHRAEREKPATTTTTA